MIRSNHRKYNKNNDLLVNLQKEFNIMIDFYKDDFDKKVEYEGYLYKIQNEIFEENSRLYNIINNEKYSNINKYYSIRYLILFLLIFIIIYFI